MTRLVCVLALLFAAHDATSAPAPFPRTARTPVLTRAALVGEWVLVWHGVPWPASFRDDGSYECRCNDTTFVGSWGVREGMLVISETCRLYDDFGWRHYSIRLCPVTLTGEFVGAGDRPTFALRRK